MKAYWHTQLTNALTLVAAAEGVCVRVLAMQTPVDGGVGLADDVIKAFSHDPGGSDG